MELDILHRLPKVWRDRISMVVRLPLWVVAFVWRTLLFRTTVIAVTGSLGKTTAKECIAAVLSAHGRTMATVGNHNGRSGVTRTIFRARPWHRYLVVEAGTDRPGGLVRASLQLRPDVVVILCVGRTHTQMFRSLDETAKEKAQIIRFLHPNGTLILNGDDPRVAAMAACSTAKTIRFGQAEGNDVVGGEMQSVWPERLRMTVSVNGERREVQTQLVGKHWTNSVLAAVAVAAGCGVPLDRVTGAIQRVEPFRSRLRPVTLPNGAVVLRDDYNGSIDSLHAAVEVLRTARCARKFLVISDCSDLRKSGRERQAYFARLAHQNADAAVFVGERCEYAAGRAVREGMDPSMVCAAMDAEKAAAWLNGQLRAGDLVLLRGRAEDHLARVFFSLLGSIRCQRAKCRLRRLCDDCSMLKFRPAPSLVQVAHQEASQQ